MLPPKEIIGDEIIKKATHIKRRGATVWPDIVMPRDKLVAQAQQQADFKAWAKAVLPYFHHRDDCLEHRDNYIAAIMDMANDARTIERKCNCGYEADYGALKKLAEVD